MAYFWIVPCGHETFRDGRPQKIIPQEILKLGREFEQVKANSDSYFRPSLVAADLQILKFKLVGNIHII